VSRSFELLQLDSVWTFQQPVRITLSARQASGFLSKDTNMGRLLQPFGRRGFPSGHAKFIRQVSQFKSKRPNASQHGPDARALYMEIHASDQRSGRPSSWSGHTKPLYGNYLQRTCDRPDDRATLSGYVSQTGKIFNEIFKISVAQLSVRTAPSLIKPNAHGNPQPINRGHWA